MNFPFHRTTNLSVPASFKVGSTVSKSMRGLARSFDSSPECRATSGGENA